MTNDSPLWDSGYGHLAFTQGRSYCWGMPDVLDELHQAIKQRGLNHHQIARETGIPESVLSRTMRRISSPRLETVEALAEYLGLRITARPVRRFKRRK